MTDWPLRKQLCDLARRVYERGYVAATDGNLSVRLEAGRVMVTPSASCLGELRPDDLCVVSLRDGRLLAGRGRATSELPMHLEIYRQRSDVGAVVHAHPPITNAFSFAGQVLDPCVIPEVVVSLGRVPTVPYATPSCAEGASAIREPIRAHDALILERHGSVTVGRDLREAYFKLEKLEHAAHILLNARLLGRVIPLSADELRRLADVCEQHGWRGRGFIERACGG